MREKLIDLCKQANDELRLRCGCSTWGDFVDHLIANGVTLDNQVSSSKWIPASERLPEIRERVLVYHDDGMIRFGINYGGLADVVSSIYLNHNHHTCFSKVTHWMPLPEPPEEE